MNEKLKPCEYCGANLPLGVDKKTRQMRSYHFLCCEKRPKPEPAAPTHSDHPLRHWDRTCPACTAASTTSEFPSVIDAKKEAIGQLGYYRQMMGTEAAPTVVEPVAWLYKNKMTQHTTVLVEWIDLGRLASEYESSPLYSTPPRTALTDEELIGKAKARGIHDADAAVCFGRAIEAAHGIGGKQ